VKNPVLKGKNMKYGARSSSLQRKYNFAAFALKNLEAID
jgi:hypothetical protein